MTEREFTLRALAQRDAAAREHWAQRNAVASLEGLGQPLPPRTLAGAIRDAGGLDGYATPADYELALLGFIADRQRHARVRLPSAASPA